MAKTAAAPKKKKTMKATAEKPAFLTLASLDKQENIHVELPETKFEVKTGTIWEPIRKYDFRVNTIRVIRVSKDIYAPQGKDMFHLHYFDMEREGTAWLPGDIKLQVLDPEKAKALDEKFYAFKLKNLHNHLSFSGGAIGSDPEIFVENGKGEIIPAFKFLGSKTNPDRAPNRTYGNNALYWDGFQAEFTTQASSCMGWHGDSIQIGLEGIFLKAKAFDKDAKLSLKTVFDIPLDMLRASAPEHVAFGCDKSFNAYGLSGLQADGQDVFFRSAGGHIHFGYNRSESPTIEPKGEAPKKSQETVTQIVKALDAILGVAGVSLFAKFDDPRRREMYGLAGEYRLPPHGLEYRVLSNAWLCHPLIANIVFDLARKAFAFGENGFMKEWKADEAETVRVINTCNVDGAREILTRNKAMFQAIIRSAYGSNQNKVDFVYNAILNGMESVIENPADIAGNWDLHNSKKWITHCDGPGKNVDRSFNQMKKV